ncbi:hypothetical protein BGZ95_009626 [Linnemannia exigua]|uniref:Ubiquitin-like protease family profile domain-containing protein n=1 Tax=Linnemannia exigua TaxID=604196 RepID=A0AAD4H5J7_9FUNG|nr:hypothetical protein BGZ95_009626 [Linnemannia exigua]
MGDHWGAVHFDLKARVITSGDSLGRDTPVTTIKTMLDWLDPPEDERLIWEKALMTVPYQSFPVQLQDDSHSCGLLAALAIEQLCNKLVKWNERSISPLGLRIRYLRLLILDTRRSSRMRFSVHTGAINHGFPLAKPTTRKSLS